MNLAARLFLSAFLYIFSIHAAALTSDEILQKAEKNFLEAKTVVAEFKLSIRWELRDTTEEKSGKLYIKHPQKYRISLGDALFISDGKTFWRYSAKSKQAIVNNAADVQNDFQPGEWLFKYSDQYKGVDLKTVEVLKAPCYAITLLPKTEARFKRVRVWINEAAFLPSKIETTDQNDNIAVYLITSISRNVPLADSFFTFKPPKGTEVINPRD